MFLLIFFLIKNNCNSEVNFLIPCKSQYNTSLIQSHLPSNTINISENSF